MTVCELQNYEVCGAHCWQSVDSYITAHCWQSVDSYITERHKQQSEVCHISTIPNFLPVYQNSSAQPNFGRHKRTTPQWLHKYTAVCEQSELLSHKTLHMYYPY